MPLYVLNNFLKFERKIYQVFGYPLGRPISIKLILYALLFGVIEIILLLLPIVGDILGILPPVLLIMLPIGVGWLLSDVGTEGRSPIHFFRSFIAYHKRQKMDNAAWYRGRKVSKETDYELVPYFSIKQSKIKANAAVKADSANEPKTKPVKAKQSLIKKFGTGKVTTKKTTKSAVKKVESVHEKPVVESTVQNIEKPSIEQVTVKKVKSVGVTEPIVAEPVGTSFVEPIHEPIEEKVEPVVEKAIVQNEIQQDKAEQNSKQVSVVQSSVPKMQVLKIEKAKKEEKVEQETSNFRYLRMAMRYNSRNKRKNSKRKR